MIVRASSCTRGTGQNEEVSKNGAAGAANQLEGSMGGGSPAGYRAVGLRACPGRNKSGCCVLVVACFGFDLQIIKEWWRHGR